MAEAGRFKYGPKELAEKPRKTYTKISIDLSKARNLEEISITGDNIIPLEVTGSLNIRLNETQNDPIDLNTVRKILTPFHTLYLSNSAQAGESATFLIGGEAEFTAEGLETFVMKQANQYIDDEGSWIKWKTYGLDAPAVSLRDRDSSTFSIFSSQALAAGGTATHEGIDVSGFGGYTALISTDQDCTVYVQFSHDGTNWYDLTDAAGTTLEYSVNNEKKAIGINDVTKYVRIVIYNNSASEATIDLDLVVTV